MNNSLEKEMLEHITEIADSIGAEEKNILPILNAIQSEYNYLPHKALEHLAENTRIPPSVIAGVSTFYTGFRHKPAGKHFVKVCIGTACHVKGANALYEDFKKHLKIEGESDTDNSRLFTVTKVACLGCCMLAPAVQIDEITYGPVSSGDIPAVLADFLKSQQGGTDPGGTASRADISGGTISICTCSSCAAAGASELYAGFRKIIDSGRIAARVKTVGCTGYSYNAPIVEIRDADGNRFKYGRVRPADSERIIFHHFRPKRVLPAIKKRIYAFLEDLVTDEEPPEIIRYLPEAREAGAVSESMGKQRRIATAGSGILDPLDFEEYVKSGGFSALKNSRENISGDKIIEIISESGLRGRGGAGFETALKWKTVKRQPAGEKYLICNADEGDPGAFMDRMILESFPFRVIEGISIAAVACGISKGYIYLRSEYPLAAERVRKALRISREKGLIGTGSGSTPEKSFDIEVFVSAGAFVCGEESALIASIEGRRGEPSFRPPFPSEKGLWGRPTLVNNVETFVMVPWIMANGPKEFAGLGTPESSGTKTFALAGKINNGGLIEIEMGTTLKEIVYGVGGGIQEGKRLKAVQVGGPSGGGIPERFSETPVDYERLKEKGTIMGSGGMVVLDEEDCIVDVAKYFMAFTQDESCGKCVFCRVGTKRMLEILERITGGKGSGDDLERLSELSRLVKDSSLCGLGRSAPNPVITALEYFPEEFSAHLEGECPAGKCKDLIVYRITDECIGCTRCSQRCPSEAITPRPYRKHEIDTELCEKCDICRKACPAAAVLVEKAPQNEAGNK